MTPEWHYMYLLLRGASQHASIMAGMPPTEIEEVCLKNEEGHVINEGLERSPDSRNGKTAVEDTKES